jgi:two-component system OmpR family response regulator
VLAELRRDRKSPVLMLTARDTVTDRVRGLDTGADDYLVKPFDLSELLARVRALIRRSAGQPDPAVTIGPVTIDTKARMVYVEGQPVALTAREYAIVEMLARHRGQVVTRSDIYDHIFDENDDSMSNLLDVHVSNIRRKLGKDFIVTRRGHGYLIDG